MIVTQAALALFPNTLPAATFRFGGTSLFRVLAPFFPANLTNGLSASFARLPGNLPPLLVNFFPPTCTPAFADSPGLFFAYPFPLWSLSSFSFLALGENFLLGVAFRFLDPMLGINMSVKRGLMTVIRENREKGLIAVVGEN